MRNTTRRHRKATRPLFLESLEGRAMMAPVMYIDDAEVIEGNGGTKNAAIVVSLSEPSNSSVTVNYKTVNGSAKSGSDYNAVSGKLTFARGETSKTILVPIRGDRTAEIDEYFSVRLSNVRGAELDYYYDEGYVSIYDNEPRISIEGGYQMEGNTGTTPLTFTVTLSETYDQPVTVNYRTANGMATSADFTAVSGKLTFAAGQTSKTISVPVRGDRLAEGDEYFAMRLSSATGALIESGEAYGWIIDNEPRISIDDVTVVEGNAGTKQATFTVSLSNPYDQAVTVNYATADDSATAGSDYVAASGQIVFAPGQTSKPITVAVQGDRVPELYEYFQVWLTTPSTFAVIDRAVGIGTIAEDEPQLSISDYSGDYATTFTFFVTLSAPQDEIVTVDFATEDATAYAGIDYVAAAGTLVFNPGELTKTITVTTFTTVSTGQYFTVRLSNASTPSLISRDVGYGYWYYDYGGGGGDWYGWYWGYGWY